MKTANLGDYFLWKGQIVQCKWMNEGRKSIGFIVKKTIVCECGKHHEIEEGYDVIEASPLFQENAEPIKSISDK